VDDLFYDPEVFNPDRRWGVKGPDARIAQGQCSPLANAPALGVADDKVGLRFLYRRL